MAHEEVIYQLMEKLVIADKHSIGSLMASKGYWTVGPSTVNNSYKGLNTLSDLKKLINGRGYFKLPSCKSEYKEHARLLTQALTEILIFNPDAIIHRELVIPEISLRPDAAILLIKDGKGKCFILEAVNNETKPYLNQKITALRTWENSLTFFSKLFKYHIPHFDIVITGDSAIGGTLQFKSYLEEVKQVDI